MPVSSRAGLSHPGELPCCPVFIGRGGVLYPGSPGDRNRPETAGLRVGYGPGTHGGRWALHTLAAGS